ncbi:MAG: Gfo/Idh/MocA family oxidoreductase [Verrucomicrobia bacterium]|nr:Gfo/Idh/MocA family oxidoreductase [Verrucomicrobiota bacterium]
MSEPKKPSSGTSVGRRDFIKSALALSGALAFPTIIPASALGKNGSVAPSERIVLAGIGIGRRGKAVLGSMLGYNDVQCVAIADVMRSQREAIKKGVDDHYQNTDCKIYRDFRDVLARPDIDAVLITIGDRWHTLASLMAAKAGKDIYCEKPCGMTIEQVNALREGIRRHGRVFQAGTQRRSQSNFSYAVGLAHSGMLGRLHTVAASVYPPDACLKWHPAEPEPATDELDWDLFLGPSPWRPYNRAYTVSRGWAGADDLCAAGNFLDWGAHTVDLCQWAAGADGSTPVEFEEEKKKQMIVGRYANGVKLVCVYREQYDVWFPGNPGPCCVRFEGDEGWVVTGDNGKITLSPNLEGKLSKAFSRPGTNPAEHARDFFDCVRSRGRTVSNVDVMRSSHHACFAAQMAQRVPRKLRFDPVRARFEDEDVNRMSTVTMREPWSLHI